MPQLILSVPREIAIRRLSDMVALGDALLAMDPNKNANGQFVGQMQQLTNKTSLSLAANDWANRAAGVLADIYSNPPYKTYDLTPNPGSCYPKVELMRNLLNSLIPVSPAVQQSSIDLAKMLAAFQDPLDIDKTGLHPKILAQARPFYSQKPPDYDTAVSNAFRTVEHQVRLLTDQKPDLYGTDMIGFILNPTNPILSFCDRKSEREGYHALYSGAIAAFKNPTSHRPLGITDQKRAFELLTFASLLMHMLDEAKVKQC